MSFLDETTSTSSMNQHYKLLLFRKGIGKYVVYVLPNEWESGPGMIYSTKVNWTENLAYYLFIFPSLNDAGIRCEWDKLCNNQFLFQKVKLLNGPLLFKGDLRIDESESVDNYAVFLQDENQTDFRIYRFSFHPAATPDLSDNTFSKNLALVLLAVVAGVCLLAFATVLTVHIMRSRKVLSCHETDHQAVSETYERRPSDGYEVLPGDRISGDYEHIVEGRRLSNRYESMLNEDFTKNMFCNRKVSSSSHYQTISLENLRRSPQEASSLSQKVEALLKVSKSCGDLADSKADTFEHADDKKALSKQESEPFCSTLDKRNSEEEEQPRLQWFMLRDPADDGPCVGAFYSIEAEKSMELKDFSTRGRCSADADGEGEYLTALDSSREHEDYLELIAD
ncbi:hypothetical protein PoB_003160200 [Plakobranchus ocellatus]|uniref:CUB domain-containing protein n=1 Tax=Plakobranchus ocellatus TaxID=259542 RepID=A0AAV4ADX4_9GAST|nr:hypothetical protein PoB_003160200 [Plakobranchus ocellatus]